LPFTEEGGEGIDDEDCEGGEGNVVGGANGVFGALKRGGSLFSVSNLFWRSCRLLMLVIRFIIRSVIRLMRSGP
jgi:hypothetical protein